MSIRDQILAATKDTDEFPREVITVPEWNGVKVVVRGLSVGDKRRLFARSRRFEEGPNNKWVVVPVDDPLNDLYVVCLSAFDENGQRIFQESDVEELAQAGDKTETAITRIAEIARRLSDISSGPVDGAVTDEATAAGKDSATQTGEQPSSSPTS